MVEQYLEHSREILTSPYSGFKWGSKGSGLISLFGPQNEYDLRIGFPLITTKKMWTRGIIEELFWFFRGETNIKSLEDKKVTVWTPNVFQHNLPNMIKEGIFPAYIGSEEAKYSDEWEEAMSEFGQRIRENDEFAERWGDAGRIYGAQWRDWRHHDQDTGEVMSIDQLGETIDKMRKKPFGKKYLVSAWNVGELSDMSLPPCHVLFQLNVINEENSDTPFLDLKLYQRSCDMFLGVPFNITSYSMLTQIIAQQLDIEPRRFIHSFGDSHFYTGLEKRTGWYKNNLPELRHRVRELSKREDYLDVLGWIDENAPKDKKEEKYDHVTAIFEQLSRAPNKLPRLNITKGKKLDELTVKDFTLEDYDPHPRIDRKMHV